MSLPRTLSRICLCSLLAIVMDPDFLFTFHWLAQSTSSLPEAWLLLCPAASFSFSFLFLSSDLFHAYFCTEDHVEPLDIVDAVGVLSPALGW